MKKKLLITAFLILLSVNAILLYFSEQAEIRSASENATIIDHFRSLQLIDRAIERDLLMLHAGQIRNYDSITYLLAQHRHQMKIFTQATATDFKHNYPLIVDAINEYWASQQKTLPLIDLYKSRSALVKNSLNYVNVLATETRNQLTSPTHDKLREELAVLMSKLVQFLTSNTAQSRNSLSEHLDILSQQLSNENHPQRARFIKLYQHITTILAGKQITSANLNAILSSPHTDMLEPILQQYLQQQQVEVQKHQLHAYASIFILLLLVATIIYSIYRLIISDLKLSAEKASLTSEVLESQESLQQSNRELKHEIEQRKQAEQELKDAATLYQNCNEGVVICDKDRKAISVNPAFTDITGIGVHEILNHVPRIFNADHIPTHIYDEMMSSIATHGEWRGEVDTRNIDGHSPKEVSVITLKEQGEIYRYIVMLTDISERKKQQETIYFQANYDPLTHLPNRNLFHERAEQMLARARRSSNKFATLFVDLDNFKKINDNLGHHTGDELLIEMALRLRQVARETDTVSRFGGDEFIILLDNIDHKHDLKIVLEKLIHCVNTPVTTTAETLHTSASIGISVYPDDGDDMATLIRCADMAMYKAKQQGKNNYCFFEERMDAEIHDYHAIENQLRHAIADDELSLVYQPILDAHNQTIYATEALVRWQHQGKLIAPDKFIPIAEESGQIVSIGEWIFRTACQQLASWNEHLNHNLKMSINVSTLQFKDPRFAKMVEKIITETGVEPANLNIEITESLFLDDNDSCIFTIMQELRAQGVSISLDDFGTGYSSLSYLKHFPINTLKIDRAFVNDVTDDVSDQSLIKAIINMAESLNIAVVAEGVETQQQFELLAEYGCNYIQGYYFSKPKSAKELQHSLNMSAAPLSPAVDLTPV